MRITEIVPTEGNVIADEMLLEKSKSKIILADEKSIGQKAFKLLCVNPNSKFKAGQIVIIESNPIVSAVKVGDKAYPIFKEYSIVGVKK